MIHVLLLAMSLQTTPIPFKTIATGADSRIEAPRTAVVRTASEWAALWKEHGGSGPPQAIDFNETMVIAVFAGTKPSAGYSVEIARIQGREGEVVVTYLDHAPRPGDMVAQMLTQPFHIVSATAHGGRVTFLRAEAKR